MARLRLRLPAAGRTPRRLRRPPRDHHARCSQPGRATSTARIAHVRGAINEPRGLQEPRIPIIVGGNGRQRTAGYAIQYRRRAELRVPRSRRHRRADARRSGSAARPRGATRRRCASRCTSATSSCATPGRPGSTVSARMAGDRARPPGRVPDPLVTDARGAGGLRRRLPGGRGRLVGRPRAGARLGRAARSSWAIAEPRPRRFVRLTTSCLSPSIRHVLLDRVGDRRPRGGRQRVAQVERLAGRQLHALGRDRAVRRSP